MIIVGERLNSSRPEVLSALSRRDADVLRDQALKQEQAGADYIDLNCAALMDQEAAAMAWAVPLLQGTVSIPLSIDSPNPEAMAEGLRRHSGQALLNSLSGESHKLSSLTPLIQEFRPRVIALCFDDQGMKRDAEDVYRQAVRLTEILIKAGVSEEDIFLDPLVHPVGVDVLAPRIFLDALGLIKKRLPRVKTIAGVSNVSFGMPQRRLLNRTFLALALGQGLDAAILDPLDRNLFETLISTQALLGQDPSLKRFIKSARAQKA